MFQKDADMNKYRFLFLMVLFLIVPPTYADIEISKQFKVSPIRMTYNDLSVMLDNVKGLLQKANREYAVDIEKVSLSVSAGEDTINIQGWEVLTEIKGLPKVGRSIRFRYRFYNAPVSELEITLTDSRREVSVSGSESSQIYAISSYLKETMDNHSTKFGGSTFRLIGGVILYGVALIFLYISYTSPVITDRNSLVLIISCMAIFISILALPWDLWFPGTAIYAESANFLDRNINIISFIGALITIAITVASLIRWGMKKNGA